MLKYIADLAIRIKSINLKVILEDMQNSVITVHKLSKVYFTNILKNIFSNSILSRLINLDNRAVKVLDDISFDVKKGEAFGIIGRNGAGKSTLLQIIAGTLIKTKGKVIVCGRVSALLELGSGFNPDFTGRENVYLTGSIFGINRAQMDKKIDEIYQFAAVGDYFDKPVRTYSSGMMMRVAFAVSVSVEPEVLIIDEALSVGDILFQQKCNKRLRELLDKGITLLVVTHDTSFVLNICHRALWLEHGKTAFIGDANICVKKYLAAMSSITSEDIYIPKKSIDINNKHTIPNKDSLNLAACEVLGDGKLFVQQVWFNAEGDLEGSVVAVGQWCEVDILVSSKVRVDNISAGCELRDRHGQVMFATGLRVVRRLVKHLPANGKLLVSIRFKMDLAPGQYTLDVGCGGDFIKENTWQRILAATIVEVSLDSTNEVIHGKVRLQSEIESFLV